MSEARAEKIIQASLTIAAKRAEVTKAQKELDGLLEGFKKLTKTSRVRVTATPASESEPARRKPNRTASKVMRVLKGGQEVRFSDILSRSGASQSVVHLALARLIEAGSVEKVSFGVYRLKK